MNLLDCMGQPAVVETVWPPRGHASCSLGALLDGGSHKFSRKQLPHGA